MDDILQVFTDDLVNLAKGEHMRARLDGEAWRPSDRLRRRLAGHPLGIKAALAVCCPDWAMLKSVFRCPQHNEKQGLCFKCKAKPSDYKKVGESAEWRREENRLNHWQCIQRMLSLGRGLSPLLGAPGMRIGEVFRLDWMHIADLGVSADFVGVAFHVLLERMPGSNVDERISSLFLKIRAHYARKPPKVEATLDNLKIGMIYPAGRRNKSPKLNAQAAEVRSLIGFVVEAGEELLRANEPIECAVRDASKHLQACYAALSHGCIFHADTLAKHCRQFCLLCITIEELSDTWHVKPKLHMFQEMCEMDIPAQPAYVWNYRDEDFGGSMASLASIAGGHNLPVPVARNVLLRFMAKHSLPRIR